MYLYLSILILKLTSHGGCKCDFRTSSPKSSQVKWRGASMGMASSLIDSGVGFLCLRSKQSWVLVLGSRKDGESHEGED